jgi:hypothetical protein
LGKLGKSSASKKTVLEFPSVASSEEPMTVSILDSVTQELAQSQNFLRIKKLLIYACSNTWENDPNRLSQYQLSALVKSLLEIAPTPEQLKIHLASVVKTLNKQAEYTLVANAIAHQCRRLYTERSGCTMLPSPLQTEPRFQEAARLLEQNPDCLRIKKLLQCACTHTWENDSDRLSHIHLLDLVRELYTLAPTPASLKSVLDSIVETLNRQEKYRLIAQNISQVFEPLYGEILAQKSSEETTLLPPSATIAPRITSQDNTAQLDSAQPVISQPIPQPIVQSNLVQPEPIQPEPIQPEPIQPEPAQLDFFDLRLDILKYANPLRVKLLIFSTLHAAIDLHDGSWVALKAYDLDELLQELFRECRSLESLEFRLNQMAKSLNQPGEYVQAVGAIINALKPLYSQPMQPRQPKVMIRQGITNSVEDYTCQLSSHSEGIAISAEEHTFAVSSPDRQTPLRTPQVEDDQTRALPDLESTQALTPTSIHDLFKR